MKTGHLIGGIAIGALVGVGIGYILGMDSEKKNQLFKSLTDKVFGGKCDCDGENCDCGENAVESVKKVVKDIVS